ncbi:AFR339Wp [Eremothecium gossypii ATCC 10895]|uniref:2'-phosphotransferase n=1 Tax=Eremothecium gossypii (strain ATCC 10895 / CBS 109.51 / FGSC 9923 / NRRL Y-1056) TaxID=284811 RepID=Q753H3_EREGS|nr:AFR339Wp [Eremothecium gossypii ATCC 10895]AAS53710.1 AFR339Wp [Eremothecium gossypii ATCC 10895]AEY98023.1 FAFR339Wp [Eremothecium gossypii FDAG1]
MPAPDPARRDVLISKSLSYLLRHGALKEQLPIDSDGYVPVSAVLAHNRLKSHRCSFSDLQRIVENNEKKRFHMRPGPDGQEYICATQGHTIEQVLPSADVLTQLIDPGELPAQLIHGTNLRNAVLILDSGCIKRMQRNHVHLSHGVTGKDCVISGMRLSSTVHIYLNTEGILDHLRLYKSRNDVYLTPSDIPVSMFKKVVVRTSRNTKADDVTTLTQRLEQLDVPFEISD